MHNAESEIASALGTLRVVDDATVDEWDRSQRRDAIRDVWLKAPRKLFKRGCSKRIAAEVDAWEDGSSLVILGNGTGDSKSAAAVRLLARLCKVGVSDGGDAYKLARGSLWARASDIVSAGGARDDEAAAALLRRARWCRLLFLDDLKETSKTLLGVFEHRYDRGLPLIVTSGAQDSAQLAQWIGGDAVFRWILEAGERPGKVVST